MIQAFFAVLLATAPVSGGAISRPPTFVQSTPFSAAEERMYAAHYAGDAETALALAKELTNRADFERQPVATRREIWFLLAGLYADTGRAGEAVGPWRALTLLPGAEIDVWLGLADVQARLSDPNAVAMTLADAVRAQPQAASRRLNGEYILTLVDNASVADDARFALRDALWDAGWTPNEASGFWANPSSGFWLGHIDDLLARGGLDRATRILPRVTSADDLVQLYALHRYDALLTRAAFPAFDGAAIHAAELASARAAASAPEAGLKAHNHLAMTLLYAGLYDEALAVIDAALTLPPPPKSQAAEWRQFTWLMELRSRTLMNLGRYDEAVDQMRSASLRIENNGMNLNVNQTINLGVWNLRLGRNSDALAAVAGVTDSSVNAFGRMQIENVRACASHALGDRAAADKAYAYLAAHWRDAPGAAYWSLSCRGDIDGMAALMVARLDDPELADDALSEFHVYLPTPHATTFQQMQDEAHARVAARPEVIAARDRVGRVLTLPGTGHL